MLMIYLIPFRSLTLIIFSIHSSQVWDAQRENQRVPVFFPLPSAQRTTQGCIEAMVITNSIWGIRDLAPQKCLATMERNTTNNRNTVIIIISSFQH